MTKQFAFFDVAGTLVAGNPWRGLLKYEGMSRLRLYASYPLIVPPYWAKNAGLISDVRFRQIWIRQMAGLLRGMHRDETNTMFRWIASEFMRGEYQEDVVARLREHKQKGAYVLLVSGMFTPMTQAFAEAMGADAGIGTELEFDAQGVCTGHIDGEGCAGERKPMFIQRYLASQGLSVDGAHVIAYADSYSDVPLLDWADKAVATYPDDGLRAEVVERGWDVMGERV